MTLMKIGKKIGLSLLKFFVKFKEKTMKDNNDERKAIFVYNSARLVAIAAKAPIVPVPWAEREVEFRNQFIEVIKRQCSSLRSSSPEELHGSWMQAYVEMGWVYGKKYNREKRIHPDLVPYKKLNRLEQDKDAIFVDLCEIARKYIKGKL